MNILTEYVGSTALAFISKPFNLSDILSIILFIEEIEPLQLS